MLYAIVALLAVIVDQWVKYWVMGNIPLESTVNELIPGVISVVNVHNSGAAFGFLSGGGARIPFIIICGVFTVAIIIALATNFISNPLGRWSAVFVMAGGIGNCIDRILYGYVQDMFMFDFAPSFPIFNVADIFITVFALLFIVSLFFGGHRDEEDDDVPARPVFKRRSREPREEAPKAEKPARKRRPKYEEEYEQYKAARAARGVQTPPSPAAQRVTVQNPSDPFAEWERANAQVEAKRQSDVAELTGQTPTVSARPAYKPYTAQTAPRQQAAPAPAPVRPAAPAAPAPTRKAAPAKQETKSEDEFSLDDILNEFK